MTSVASATAIDAADATVDQTGAVLLPGCSLLDNLRNGTWLDTQEFPPLRYAVPELIPEGMTVLVGAPKIGKSRIVLDLGIAVAAGGDAYGAVRTGDPRPVLYLALEDGDRRLQQRCRMVLANDPIPARFQYLTRVNGSVLDTANVWLNVMGNEETGQVVIFDTLGKVMPPARPGESAYARDYRIASELKRLADDYPGTALIVVHHDRKAGSEDFVDAVSGTHGIAGAADTIAAVTRTRGEDTAMLKITGRDVLEREYALTLEEGQWRLDGDDLEAAAKHARLRSQSEGLGDQSAKILAFVVEQGVEVTPKLVASKLGLDNQTVGKYLKRLADNGRISLTGRGR